MPDSSRLGFQLPLFGRKLRQYTIDLVTGAPDGAGSPADAMPMPMSDPAPAPGPDPSMMMMPNMAPMEAPDMAPSPGSSMWHLLDFS